MNKAIFITATTLLLSSLITPAISEDGKTLIDRVKESPHAIPLNPKGHALDVGELFDDHKDNPKRDPGPINIQRTVGGFPFQGIPTFFHAPVALTPEDLKAGKVDVAIMGASLDMSTGMRGAAWAPQAIRTAERIHPWGDLIERAHPHVGQIDFKSELKIVDYGDAPIDIMSQERSFPAIIQMVEEIARTGAIPVIVGGDHSLMYPDLVAVTNVYGKGKVGVVHFDAHFDGEEGFFGHYISHGSPVRLLIDEGHVKGKNFVQVGLHSISPGAEAMEWMRKNQIRYHTMADIDKNGWDAVMKKVLAEALDGPEYLFLSIDLDCLEPAFAPGMGTPEPGGMSPTELMKLVRGLAAQNKIVGIDLVEVNPIVDQSYLTPLVALRILGEAMTGIAMRKKGITDPLYADPKWVDHGVPMSKKTKK